MPSEMVPVGEGRWFCPKTDLVLLDMPEVPAWRVFQHKFGSPLKPPRRSGHPDTQWSRYDIDGHATLYGANILRGAFLECLAYAVYDPRKIPVHAMFDDVAPWEDPILDDWQQLFHMDPGTVPANWRTARQYVDMRFQNPGYYVEISAAETVGSLRRSAAAWAPLAYVKQPAMIDMASLTGGDRALTCAAAKWLAQQRTHDGQPINGIRYLSKHGADLVCWARWVAVAERERVDTAIGKVATHGPPKPIPSDHPDLRWAARQLGIVVW